MRQCFPYLKLLGVLAEQCSPPSELGLSGLYKRGRNLHLSKYIALSFRGQINAFDVATQILCVEEFRC